MGTLGNHNQINLITSFLKILSKMIEALCLCKITDKMRKRLDFSSLSIALTGLCALKMPKSNDKGYFAFIHKSIYHFIYYVKINLKYSLYSLYFSLYKKNRFVNHIFSWIDPNASVQH